MLVGDPIRAKRNYSRYVMPNWEVLFSIPTENKGGSRQVMIMWIEDNERECYICIRMLS